VAQQPEDLLGGLGVQVAGRLVGEHDRGTVDQRSGDGHALLLAAGELGRAVREAVTQADGGDQRVEPLAVDLAAGQRERQQDVLLGGEDRYEVEGLEDEAETIAAQPGAALVVERGDLLAVDDDRARGRAVEAGEQVHQRRLARARRTHDRRELPGGEAHGDAAQGVHGRLSLAVDTGQVGRRDDLAGWGRRRLGKAHGA
jgi:hypothetical protein